MRERKLVREYKKIGGQELRRVFCLLTKLVQVSEKSSKKAEKIKIAKGLVKQEFLLILFHKQLASLLMSVLKKKQVLSTIK